VKNRFQSLLFKCNLYRYSVALFDAYLGKDPVVPGAKQSLGEQLAGSVTG
jgi:hypothetical protein